MGRYPHLVLHRRRWMVRLIVPADVRPVLGQSVYKISTGETDEHRAVVKAAPIIAGIKDRIRAARATLKKPIETTAEELAEAYRARQSSDPASGQAFVLSEVITFVLQQQGHSWADYGRQVREAGYDAYAWVPAASQWRGRRCRDRRASPAGPRPFSSISMTGNHMRVWFQGASIKPSPRSSSSPGR